LFRKNKSAFLQELVEDSNPSPLNGEQVCDWIFKFFKSVVHYGKTNMRGMPHKLTKQGIFWELSY